MSQCRDFVFSAAKNGREQVFRIGAKQRRRAIASFVFTSYLNRISRDRAFSRHGMFEACDHAPVFELRILDDAADSVDGTARYAGHRQYVVPLFRILDAQRVAEFAYM
jgi:hypothetical protein